MARNDDTFMKITNKDIYDEMKSFHDRYEKDHRSIIERLDTTNGKVKLSKWISTTALTVCIIILGYLFEHISK